MSGSDVVSGRGVVNTKQMQQIGQNLPNLTHLDIGGCEKFDDTLFDTFHSLRYVNMENTTGIS